MHLQLPTRPKPGAWPGPLRVAAGLLLLAPSVAAAQSAAPSSPQPGALQPLACLIQPARVAEVGSPVIGVVESIDVERGDTVRSGQVMARLRADVERASTDAVRSRAHSEAELRAAIAARDLAQLRLERARTLKDQNFVSTQAVEQAHAELKVAHERVGQVRDALRTASRELTVSDAQLAQRVVRAPFDGVIVERYANPGERFEDKPLFKVAAIAQLRVEVVAPTALYGILKPGREVTVLPELPGAKPRTARIAQIDRVLDPASNTFRLRLDLPNPDHSLPAGLRCRVDLGSLPAEISPAPAAAHNPAVRP